MLKIIAGLGTDAVEIMWLWDGKDVRALRIKGYLEYIEHKGDLREADRSGTS